MNVDPLSLTGWTPTRFFWQASQPTVEWCRFGERRFGAPFFRQSADAARTGGCPTRLTSADTLHAFADTASDLPLAGLIFHLSRCGSTLVSRMLGALPANVVLSEPEPLEGVLHAAASSPGIDEATRVRWLRGLVHAYGERRFPEERRVVIKLDPWHLLDLEAIRAALPGVPGVCVYRDPVEILASLSDNIAGTFAPTPGGAAAIGLTFMEGLSLTSEEYCARVLARLGEAAADAAERDPAWKLVNYLELPEAVLTRVVPGFGLSVDAAEAETMRRVARFHAKAPGERVFQEDSARKQRDADAELRDLAERWVGPGYARLERQRLARASGVG